MTPIKAVLTRPTGFGDREDYSEVVTIIDFVFATSEDRSRSYGQIKGLHAVCIMECGSITMQPASYVTASLPQPPVTGETE